MNIVISSDIILGDPNAVLTTNSGSGGGAEEEAGD